MYDGNSGATLSSNTVVLTGVVSGDDVSLVTNGYTASFASPDVADGIGVTVGGLTLGGASCRQLHVVAAGGIDGEHHGSGVDDCLGDQRQQQGV